jgi:thioredoxin reductase
MRTPIDATSIVGKIPPPEEMAQVLVIGAGPAGLSAAIEAARRGSQVTLVDENPVDPALMALDVPLYFGGRASGAAGHAGNVIEQMYASDACFEEAMEAGVDIRLGVTAWALYANTGALQALPVPMVALADRTHSWMCGFDKLVLATGARDIAFALKGWDQPGVMGAVGFRSLTQSYDAFSGRRLVILGSGPLALRTALLAQDKGLEVAAIVEVLADPQGDKDLVERVRAWKIPILTEHVPLEVTGGTEGVEHITLLKAAGKRVRIRCDTLCVAVGRVPSIELLGAASGRIVADSCRGGHVPVLDGWQTSIEHVFAAGDCGGLTQTPADAAEQGRDAVRQALGGKPAETVQLTGDAWKYQAAWIRALSEHAGESLIICQCEGVSRGDLLGLRAPSYVGPSATRSAEHTLSQVLADGPVNQDQVKRLTRACMGVCQARRCREQIALTLAQAAGVFPDDVPLATYRAPVRPLPLQTLADSNESLEMRALWRPWFDIPGQLAPYEDIGTEREFQDLYGNAKAGSEGA